jgi:hypothetical protein
MVRPEHHPDQDVFVFDPKNIKPHLNSGNNKVQDGYKAEKKINFFEIIHHSSGRR